MKVGIITQARLSSTRLPGKVLRQIQGKTLLEYHLDRLADSGYPVYLATSEDPSDDPLEAFAQAQAIPYCRGSLHDVLARFAATARKFDLDVIVRVTSDCPLIDGKLVAQGISEWLSFDNDQVYLSNALERTFPRGMDFEIFSRAMLEEAMERADQPAEREHVTPYFYLRELPYRQLKHVVQADNAADLRITVDTPEDFALVRELIEGFAAQELDHQAITHILRTHPELVALNAAIEQKKL